LRNPLLIPALALCVTVVGCATRGASSGELEGAPAPGSAVESFLLLVDARDYSGMGWVFGTSAGPVLRRDPPSLVEQRMYGIAELLTHDGFAVGGGSPLPGRGGNALRYEVALSAGTRSYLVPFTAVRGPRGRWYVEDIGLEAITR